MKIVRRFTTQGHDPFDSVAWGARTSRITNPDGSVVFEMKDAEAPESWSQLAVDIMVSKYFRKAGVPQAVDATGRPVAAVFEDGKPVSADGSARLATDATGKPVTGPERSARQVIHRLVGCWTHWGQRHGYFDTRADAEAFRDELTHMLVHQVAAPNSPQWFNTGLHWAFGLTGPAQGHFVADPKTGKVSLAKDAYTHPQPHACFIQSVSDDLVNEGGIMDLWVREARLFKYGSGTGTNFSGLRAEGEKLSGGGRSSGLMSWLRIGDRAAGAIKSGGTTRRAAKMVCLDMDHPDIEAFINWKVREEIKVSAMVEGLARLPQDQRDLAAELGLTLDYDFNGEAYYTVSGQNSNNSVRVPDAFLAAVRDDAMWDTRFRTSGQVARTCRARDLWNRIAFAAWRCADPGVQYDTTINAWHTCPGGGRINASNPCSEYMFLDNTACNLASINVLKFYDPATRVFDAEGFEHAVDLWTMVLEISVLMASFPSREIAELSHRYRTLGLGYANLGAMLMQAGIPYDSDEARAIGAVLTAVMTGRSYRQSAVMASKLGPFPGYASESAAMLRVIRNHRRAALGVARDSAEYEGLDIRPVPIDRALLASGRARVKNAGDLAQRAERAWDEALAMGVKHGYRNAQVTVIAPTGTIGLLMDCDTTGVEPDFALVKFKKLAGGGCFKIANASVEPALAALGYGPQQVREMLAYLLGKLSLHVPMPRGVAGVQPGETFAQWLIGKGLSDADLEAVTAALPGVFELSFAFAPYALGDAALRRLGLDPAVAKADPAFSTLRALGLKAEHAEALNRVVCGSQTLEGAPHLRPEHQAVFDCANTCGPTGKRYIRPEGHIRMMAACQPFISGAISKTINLPNHATVDEIKACYWLSWELGLKATALYRDGCKLSQPLSSASSASAAEDEEDELELSEARAEVAAGVGALAAAVARADTAGARDQEVRVIHRPMRRRLPDTRQSITHKFNIAGHEGYLTVGLYDDGMPGELFITMAKEGSTIGGLMDSLGTATSVALQYGVPVDSLVTKFTHQRFEPAGMTTNPDIPFAKSLVDYIFRWLGMQFIPGYRDANAPARQGQSLDQTSSTAVARPQPVEASRWSETHEQRGPGRQVVEPKGLSDHPSIGRSRPATEQDHGPIQNPAPGQSLAAGPDLARRRAAEPPSQFVVSVSASTLTVAMESLGDSPACDVCGTITVRSGTCYKCMNCGNSMGCS